MPHGTGGQPLHAASPAAAIGDYSGVLPYTASFQ